jgi:two-component system sensor histidine kinase MprB
MELNWASLHNRRSALPDELGPGGPGPAAPLWPSGPLPVGLLGPHTGAVADVDAETAGTADELEGPGASEAPEDAGTSSSSSRSPLAWLRQISFRSRISILVVVAVGVAVAMAALVSYIAVSRQLEQQVTANLNNALAETSSLRIFPSGPNSWTLPPDELIDFGDRTGDVVQVITKTDFVSDTSKRLFRMTPGAEQALKESPNDQVPVFETLTASNGSRYRVASETTLVPGLAVQIGYPLNNMDNTLAFLRLMLILVALGGVALATCLGWAVGRASMRPVEGLTLAAEHVAETQDLTATIDESGNDELARLAHSFNAMLTALATSKRQQAQLVSDAGHELRTPLTSLRTNIEVLMRAKDLRGADRDELLADVDAQLKELTTLVGDLVDLARDDERPEAEPVPVAFNEIVERAVERAQRRALSVRFDVSLEPGQVCAQPALLERAVMNVLDNAAKWSPRGGHVSVNLEAKNAWHLTVTDQGPGISAEHLPHIFDRFYRAPSARSMPGSGLGLSIVKRVVTSHGGTVDITTPASGGTRVDIVLPLETASGPTNGQVEEPGEPEVDGVEVGGA